MIYLILSLVLVNSILISRLYWMFIRELKVGKYYYVDCPLSEYERDKYREPPEDMYLH